MTMAKTERTVLESSLLAVSCPGVEARAGGIGEPGPRVNGADDGLHDGQNLETMRPWWASSGNRFG